LPTVISWLMVTQNDHIKKVFETFGTDVEFEISIQKWRLTIQPYFVPNKYFKYFLNFFESGGSCFNIATKMPSYSQMVLYLVPSTILLIKTTKTTITNTTLTYLKLFLCFVFIAVTEEVVLIPGGYSDSRGPISEVQLYSPNGECQLQVNQRK
jgi:hypothetical protein